jgi:hypothetical protein
MTSKRNLLLTKEFGKKQKKVSCSATQLETELSALAWFCFSHFIYLASFL